MPASPSGNPKYYYQFWRPVTGIREGGDDGNAATVGDPTFVPLRCARQQPQRPEFMPPFPAYPSGHTGFGGALFETLRNFYRTDDIAFTFVSDEYNGVTQDYHGHVRPLIPRSFSSLSQAEEENGQSRIYLGIYWAFDKTAPASPRAGESRITCSSVRSGRDGRAGRRLRYIEVVEGAGP
jgi:PAP2 superfamily